MPLEEYRRKRDFSKTPEPPPGGPNAAENNLVFVVQQHAARRMHWDFRLEVEGVLKSWPLPNGPSLDPKVKRMAVMTEDHPYDYRNFEGVIPKGEYGGGQVIIWDEGIYTPDEGGVTSWNDKAEGSRRMLEGIAKGKLSFTLQGKKLHGSFALVKTKYAPDSWLMLKHRDEHAGEQDLLKQDASVRSGLTIADLKEGRLPGTPGSGPERLPGAREAPFPDAKRLEPMLAELALHPFDKPGWTWEPKLDGIRILAFIRDGEVQLRSRRGVDVTKQYPALVESLKAQPLRTAVLDGEVCALDEEGIPRFERLQPRINLTRGMDPRRLDAEIPVVYYAFDLLYADGFDLMGVPLQQRKPYLERRVVQGSVVRTLGAFTGNGIEIAAGAEALGFEGIVGKRADSRYEPGSRSRAWIKIKSVREQELVVGGYTKGEGGRGSTFGALALGYYDDEEGRLRYAGNVGSGFNDKELSSVWKRLQALETAASPFQETVPDVTFVRPELVVQVKFTDWTRDGRLRAPVFIGVRPDIDPGQVRRERPIEPPDADTGAPSGNGAYPAIETPSPGRSSTNTAADTGIEAVLAQLQTPKAGFGIEVEGEAIKLTNLDKAFWPAYKDTRPLTKRDLIEYYVKLSPVLLPHLRDRPLTLTRYPNGVQARPFYQKHYEQPMPPFVQTVRIWSESNKADGDYILCNNLATLVWLGQLADLELHAWMARIDPEPDATERTTSFNGSETALDASVLNYPDFMVVDLDPYIYSGREGKGEEPEYNRKGWEKTVEMALRLRELLDQARLSSFIKTSGKTGLHVYVPLLRHFDYDAVREINKTIGQFLVQERPREVTMEWDTSKRRGKVFFDVNQNTRGKTLAAQYSPRPTAWAGVSTPIAWSELPGLDPTSLNLLTVPERIAQQGDPWADILQHKSDLSALFST